MLRGPGGLFEIDQGKRPFGCDIVSDGDVRRLVANAAEMAVIDRMKAMRRDGATLRPIGNVTPAPRFLSDPHL